MAYDKFIKKKGKIYGPYIYESVRDGDKVLTKYIGKGKNFSVRDIEEKRAPFTFNSSKIISMFLIVLGILALVTLLQFPTARVTMEISSTYDVGKPILGSLNLGFKPGELIPAGSSVLVSLGSQEKEFLISDLVDSDSVFGNFYAEGVDLEGEGEGIGIIGEKVSYPEIDFSFIVQDKGEDVEIGEGVGGGTDEKESEEVVVEEPSQDEDEGVIEEPKDKTDGKDKKDTSESEEDGSGETNTGDDVESSPESSESSEDSGSESDSSESGSDSGGDGGSSSDESGEELSVVPTQPTLSGGENNNEGSDSGGDSVSSGDSGGSDSGGSEGGSDSVSSGDSGGDSGGGDSGGDSGAGITGSVVQTNKVDGKVSYENDFSYNLEEGQTAKLVSGSIKVDGKKIDTDSVNLIVEGNVVRVSTEYFISEEGFGEEYLGVETEIISINLEDVNILAEQGILQVNLDYNGVEIVEVSGEINVEGGNLTTGNLTETNMSTNLTIGNLTETNLTLVNATLVNLTDGNLSFVGNVEDIVILKGENYSFDLSVYFANAESYNVSLMENISVEILESEMKFVPDVDFVGRRVGKIFGYKGNESVESNIFSVSVIDSNYSENTIQFDAEIRKPVKWRKIVKLGEPSNLNIQLHKSSENITVNKIVGEIVEKISDESVSITAQVISGDVTAELEIEEEPGIIRFFKNLFSGIGNFITGRAIEVIEEETVVNVEITENSSEYEIEYYTVAPEAYERNVSENKKEIVVTAPDELNYTNVLTYTTVREVLDSEKRIKLYWIREVVDTVVVPTQPTLSVEEIINDEIVDTEEEIINEINETDFVGNEIDIVVDNNESLVEIGEELINNNTESEVDSDISDENVSIASISGFAVNNDGDEVVDDSNQQAQEELVEGGGVGVRYERVLMNYTGYDLDNNGMIDYVEWITPHLSNQTFELIIEITGAEHLDENRVFIEDIFEQVNSRDFVYKEIPVGNYVRVTFEEELDSSKDITIYGYSNESGSVEVYEENGEVKIAEFGVISSDDVYKIYLSNLTGTQDVFDLKVVGGNVVFDYIVDPGTKIICPYGCRKLSPGNWTTNANITVQFFSNQTDDLNLSNATFLLWNSTGGLIHENTTNITGINNLTAWNWTFSYDDYYNWSVLVMDNDSNTNWSDSGESYSVINWTLLICNVTAPGVNFSAPTLPNNTATMNKTIEINTSISEICIDEIVYNWNGTNFTMYNDSLVLFMNFDNQSFQGEDESFVKDLSSYGNDGTITNARVNVTNCKYGKCLTFDGSGDYVDAGNFDDYTSGPLTISAWFKAEQQSEYAYLISKAGANSDNKYFVIGLDNSPDVYEANIFNGAASSGTVLIARQSGWQYLTYTWDGTNSLLYSNGVLVDSTTGTQSGGSASIKLGIGARYTTSWGSYFNGQMDEVMIWNRSLSASEVYQQYVSNLYKYDTDKWALWVNQGKNSTTGLFDGEYTYFTSVKDCCERENKTALWEFNVDTIAPYGVHVLPKNWTSTTNITVEFIVNSSKENYNLANVTLFIWNSSGGLVHQNTTNITGVVNYTFWNFTFTNNDVYNWSALIYDEAGNFNWTDEMNGLGAINWSLNETGIATDATNPAVTINLPLNKTYNTATILFNATTSESSLCFFSIDSGVYNYS
ncbi:MAG: LamG domain-containing protein, partial [Nanoarchaeota archaeon]|nr:LamG domain-containing protein [Nanoarchaeota archaeon]